MKTIQSLLEAFLFNLLPPELAAHLLAFLKNIIPLLGLVFIRLFLYIVIGLQKLNGMLNQNLRNEGPEWRLSFQKQY